MPTVQPMAAPVLPPIEAQLPAMDSRFWKSCISHIPFHVLSVFPLLANTVYHVLYRVTMCNYLFIFVPVDYIFSFLPSYFIIVFH